MRGWFDRSVMIGQRLARSLVVVIFAIALVAANEGYDDRLAQTDRSDPDALYELVEWCRANGFHASANQHIREILALNPNHAPTRELQGFVFDGQRWVHRSRLPPALRERQANKPSDPPLTRRQVSKPGPQAADIEWDLSIPQAPAEEARYRPFLASVITKMNGQDIFAMEGSWRTLIRPEHRYQSISQLAEEIMAGTYTDLWGPSMMATTLYSSGEATAVEQAKSLLPFLVKLSSSSRNPDAQLAFTAVAAQLGDRRVVPHLIDLLQSPMSEAQGGARQALSAFMLFREQDVTVDQARDWWARHHASSESTIFSESLSDPNPWVRLTTVRHLTNDSWDARVMPVLFRLARENDSQAVAAAGRELERITGNDWGINRHTSAEDRQRISAQLQEWWEENRHNFVPVWLRNRPSTSNPVRDPLAQWVDRLQDPERAAAATQELRRAHDQAIPALIQGLQSSNGIIRNRARDLLREISGQQFGFEGIRGNDGERQEALRKWQQWASEAGHLPAAQGR